MRVEEFFKYARERESIRIKRYAQPFPWTDDKILQENRFCNVFREDDKTTIWFRENVRNFLQNYPRVLPATVIFRWFNRIETGEKILDLLVNADKWDTAEARKRLTGVSPVVTGSYIIKTPNGMTKLEGLLWCFDQFLPKWRELYDTIIPGTTTMETLWTQLQEFPFLGQFMAYEIVTDLRFTHILKNAPDIMTWANPGPGAARGMGRLVEGADINTFKMQNKKHRQIVIEKMQELLEASKEEHNWPKEWQQWEMREIEHTLCEFDKYERIRLGEGKMKQKFRVGAN